MIGELFLVLLLVGVVAGLERQHRRTPPPWFACTARAAGRPFRPVRRAR